MKLNKKAQEGAGSGQYFWVVMLLLAILLLFVFMGIYNYLKTGSIWNLNNFKGIR